MSILKTTITENSSWTPAIYLIEITDLLQGYNPDTEDIGVSNLQGQQLANRTLYLKDLFLVEHTEHGDHNIRDINVHPNAGIAESKLSLDYSTSYLNQIGDQAYNEVVATHSRIMNISGVEGSLIGALAKAIPQSWKYSDHGFEFELFTGSLTFRDSTNIGIIEAITGDDSIDVTDSKDLVRGQSYILHDGMGVNSELVTVKEILTKNRVLFQDTLQRMRTSGTMGSTSWIINKDGTATAKRNGMLVSREIDVARNYENGRLVLRRDTGDAVVTIKAKRKGSYTWEDCPFVESIQRTENTRDEEYTLPGGVVTLFFQVSSDCTIHHIVVFPKAVLGFSDDIRRPLCVSPANLETGTGSTPTLYGSEYYSLYGLTQKTSHFQIATDEAFVNIVFDKEQDGPGITCVVPPGLLDETSVYFWRCRYTDIDDNISQWSPTAGFTTLEVFSYIETPQPIAPAMGQHDLPGYGVTLVASAFSIKHATDTHKVSQWQISETSDFAVIVHDSGETPNSKTTYIIPDGVLQANKRYYWRCRYKGNTIGFSGWCVSNFYTKVKFTRHGERLEGRATIIGNSDGNPFMINGRMVWIAVLDAVHRGVSTKYGTFGTDTPVPNLDGDPLGTVAMLETEGVTDARTPSEVNTSRENCDALMVFVNNDDLQAVKGVPAVEFCRSVFVDSTACDLPSVKVLTRLLKLKSFIDANDPTAAVYPTKKMSNWGFGSNSGPGLWSSSENNEEQAIYVYFDGGIGAANKGMEYGVVPILEIPA